MRLSVTILFLIFSFKSFSQEKENNGTIYKNGPYVEAVRNLMYIRPIILRKLKKLTRKYLLISLYLEMR